MHVHATSYGYFLCFACISTQTTWTMSPAQNVVLFGCLIRMDISETFTHPRLLRWMRNTHANDPKYWCRECDASCYSSPCLLVHISTHWVLNLDKTDGNAAQIDGHPAWDSAYLYDARAVMRLPVFATPQQDPAVVPLRFLLVSGNTTQPIWVYKWPILLTCASCPMVRHLILPSIHIKHNGAPPQLVSICTKYNGVPPD